MGSSSLQALGKPWAREPCSGSWSWWEKTGRASSSSHQVCEQTSSALLIWNTKHIKQSRSWWKPSYTCPGWLKSVRVQCMAGLSHLLKDSMSADSRIRDCRWDTWDIVKVQVVKSDGGCLVNKGNKGTLGLLSLFVYCFLINSKENVWHSQDPQYLTRASPPEHLSSPLETLPFSAEVAGVCL